MKVFAQAVWDFDSCNLPEGLLKAGNRYNGIDSGAKEKFQEH